MGEKSNKQQKIDNFHITDIKSEAEKPDVKRHRVATAKRTLAFPGQCPNIQEK